MQLKKLLTVVLFFTPVLVWADINSNCSQFTPAGAPTYLAQPGDQELCRINYAVIHRCSTKTPAAVFEHVTTTAVSGKATRKNNFRADTDVTVNCRATLDDYAGPEYDRGHMAPAGDNTASTEIMSQSFYLSNMVPQVPNNNRGIWRQLESQVRGYVTSTPGDFYVVSGPIYDAGYENIGNSVGVPTRLFKIIYEKKFGNTMAYLMPNGPLLVTDLPKYQTTVQAIEEATGFKFLFK
jgi:endonuclease G